MQDNIDAMDTLAESSTIMMFNSKAMMKEGYTSQQRVLMPIEDSSFQVTYYVACLENEKMRYRSFFNTVRAEAMKEE